MAQIDTGIYQNLLRAPRSALEYASDYNALDQQRIQNELGRAQVQIGRQKADEYARGLADDAALREATQGFGADPEANYGQLTSRGLYKPAADYRKSVDASKKDNAAAAKDAADTEKKTLETAITKQSHIAQLAGTATDQTSWTRARELAGYIGADVSQIPEQFDPGLARQLADTALSRQQQLEQVWKSKGYELDVRRQGESERHNKTTEGISAGQLKVSQGQLGVSQAQLGVARGNLDLRGKELSQRAAENVPESGLPVLGVPKPSVAPWSNQSNAKDANKVKLSEQTRGAKEIEKDVDAARKEKATADAAARFLELNKKVSTGGLTDKFGAGRWVQGMGSDYSEMEAITARLAPAMREPGSGSASDFDGKQFERATVGVDKPAKANENIAKGIIARAQQAQDYADFRNTYLEQNGTLSGADRYWKQYADKNPIFDPAKPNTFDLNQNRKPWQAYFKGAKPDAPADSGRLSAAEQAELEALRKQLGRK